MIGQEDRTSTGVHSPNDAVVLRVSGLYLEGYVRGRIGGHWSSAIFQLFHNCLQEGVLALPTQAAEVIEVQGPNHDAAKLLLLYIIHLQCSNRPFTGVQMVYPYVRNFSNVVITDVVFVLIAWRN